VVKVERPGVADVTRAWDTAVRGLSSGFAAVTGHPVSSRQATDLISTRLELRPPDTRLLGTTGFRGAANRHIRNRLENRYPSQVFTPGAPVCAPASGHGCPVAAG
jgi:hypothetical protein